MFYRCILRGGLLLGIRHRIEAPAKSTPNYVAGALRWYADTSNRNGATPHAYHSEPNPWNERREVSRFNSKLVQLRDKRCGRLRLGLTWTTGNEKKLDEQAILDSLPPCHHFAVRSLVFLVTPSQVHLLDQQGFLSSLLHRLFTSGQRPGRAQEPIEVKTIAAVVDALPHFSSYRETRFPSEGISILVSGENMSGMSTPSTSGNDGQDHYTLQFINRLFRDPDNVTHVLASHVQLPVANTLFVNGTRATLFEDSWSINMTKALITPPEPDLVVHRQRIPLTSSTIPLPHSVAKPIVGLVPTDVMTEPRKILNAMGNVVAEIEIDGVAVPASTELETAVSEYLNQRPNAVDNGPLRIYALVRPGSPESNGMQAKKFQEILRDVPSKAKLFKVTGGGGGWGKKKGLLSLDPAIDFESVPEVSNFPDVDRLDDMEGEIKLKGMMPADSTIQFLVWNNIARLQQPPQPRNGQAPTAKEFSDSSETLTCVIGTCLNPEGESLDVDAETLAGKEQTCFHGAFGMFSFEGSAVGLERSIDRGEFITGARSRLDIPDAITKFIMHILPVDKGQTLFKRVVLQGGHSPNAELQGSFSVKASHGKKLKQPSRQGSWTSSTARAQAAGGE